MILDVAPNHISRHFIPNRAYKVASAPKMTTPQFPPQPGKLTEQLPSRDAFQNLHGLSWRQPRRRFQEYVDMIFHNLHCIDDQIILLSNPFKHLLGIFSNFFCQDSLTVLRNPHKMVLEIVDCMLASSQSTHASTVPLSLPLEKREPTDQESAFLPPASWGASSGNAVKLIGSMAHSIPPAASRGQRVLHRGAGGRRPTPRCKSNRER